MATGRSLMYLRGKVPLTEQAVVSTWKGQTVARSMARQQSQIPSDQRKDINTVASELANAWKQTLTTAQRDAWEEYAHLVSTGAEAMMQVGGTHNVIPNRPQNESGEDAYVGLNINHFTTRRAGDGNFNNTLAGTFANNPPIGESIPPPPSAVSSTWAAGTLNVTWTAPFLVSPASYAAKAVRVWFVIRAGSRKSGHRQLAGAFATAGDGTTPETIALTTYRGGGSAMGTPRLLSTLISRNLIRIQLETVVARTIALGAIASAPSELREQFTV